MRPIHVSRLAAAGKNQYGFFVDVGALEEHAEGQQQHTTDEHGFDDVFDVALALLEASCIIESHREKNELPEGDKNQQEDDVGGLQPELQYFPERIDLAAVRSL